VSILQFGNTMSPQSTSPDQTDAAVFVRRLAMLYPLQAAEIQAAEDLIEDVHTVAAHQIVLQGDQPSDEALVLLRGMACHYKTIDNVRRQLTGFVLPGDFCDYGFLSSSSTGQCVATLTRCVLGKINLARLSGVAERHPHIVVAAMRGAAVDRASARELAVSLGARDALQRLAHLLCEIHYRLRVVGLVSANGRFEFGVTQSEIGEALGLSTVHVNRTIQQLRRRKLVTMGQGQVTILDAAALAAVAVFDPRYLRPN
jgi:CRP-like cAMP-binding protein